MLQAVRVPFHLGVVVSDVLAGVSMQRDAVGNLVEACLSGFSVSSGEQMWRRQLAPRVTDVQVCGEHLVLREPGSRRVDLLLSGDGKHDCSCTLPKGVTDFWTGSRRECFYAAGGKLISAEVGEGQFVETWHVREPSSKRSFDGRYVIYRYPYFGLVSVVGRSSWTAFQAPGAIHSRGDELWFPWTTPEGVSYIDHVADWTDPSSRLSIHCPELVERIAHVYHDGTFLLQLHGTGEVVFFNTEWKQPIVRVPVHSGEFYWDRLVPRVFTIFKNVLTEHRPDGPGSTLALEATLGRVVHVWKNSVFVSDSPPAIYDAS